MLAVACTNVYGGCNAMARRDAVVQPYQFVPESDPEGEAPEEVQTLQLQQDISEWLVCLNNVSLFVSKFLDTIRIVSVSSLQMFPDFLR